MGQRRLSESLASSVCVYTCVIPVHTQKSTTTNTPDTNASTSRYAIPAYAGFPIHSRECGG